MMLEMEWNPELIVKMSAPAYARARLHNEKGYTMMWCRRSFLLWNAIVMNVNVIQTHAQSIYHYELSTYSINQLIHNVEKFTKKSLDKNAVQPIST